MVALNYLWDSKIGKLVYINEIIAFLEKYLEVGFFIRKGNIFECKII